MKIWINGKEHEVAAGITVAELLVQLQMRSRYLAVERNLELVPRGQHARCALCEGDKLEIVTLEGGG